MEYITHNKKIKKNRRHDICFMLYVPYSMKQKGFSLVELIVALAIFSLIIFTTITVFLDVFSGSKQQFLAVDNVDSARSVTSRFVNEVRNASVGVDGSYQINTALNNQVIFYSKTPSFNGVAGGTVNRINYYLTGTTLYKGVIVPSGNPLKYNLGSEVITIVQKDVVSSGTSILTYYDGNYNGTSAPLTQPINVNNIKYIKMNLIVLNQVKAQSNSQFSITAGANIRNLKNNLGN